MNILLKILFIQTSLGAMIMLFYAAFREAAIDKIVKRGMDMGYSMTSENREEANWFSDRIRKWSIGTIYSSGSPVIIGLIILGYVITTVLVAFSFRELVEIVIFSFVLFHIFIRMAKQNAQAFSFLAGIIGVAGTVMALLAF
jgi:uncharacterized protein YacL